MRIIVVSRSAFSWDMQAIKVDKWSSRYPCRLLSEAGQEAPDTLTLIGNTYVLDGKLLALFCSERCPDELAVNAFLLGQWLRRSQVTVVSGFHSLVESEILSILLKSTGPLIVCPAREIDTMRIPEEYREAIEMGRLLLLSPFTEKRRTSADMAAYRNRFIVSLADEVFVAYAAPGGKTERLAKQVMEGGKKLYTFSHRTNKNLLGMGATPIYPDHIFR